MTPELKHRMQRASVALQDLHQQLQQETNEVRARGELVESVHHFADLRNMRTVLKEMKEGFDKLHDFLSREVIPDIFRDVQMKTGLRPPHSIEGIGVVNVSLKWNASMIDKVAGKDWLRNNGASALIIETVPAPSLSAYAKDLFDTKEQELPNNIFKSGRVPYVSITKAEYKDAK